METATSGAEPAWLSEPTATATETETAPEATPDTTAAPEPKAAVALPAWLAEDDAGDDTAEVTDQVTEQGDPLESAPEPEPEPELFEVKINGKTKHVTRDQLLVMAQKAEASDERFREAHAKAQEAEAIREALKSNPWEALEKLGVDVDMLAADRLITKAEFDAMTPAEKEAYAQRQKLADYERAEQQRKEQAEAERQTQLEQRFFEDFQRDFHAALDSSGLPKNEKNMALVAKAQRQAMEYGYQLSPTQLATAVKEQIKTDVASVLKGASPEHLIELLGADAVKRLQSHRLEKLRPTPKSAPAARTKADDAPRPTGKSYFDALKAR